MVRPLSPEISRNSHIEDALPRDGPTALAGDSLATLGSEMPSAGVIRELWELWELLELWEALELLDLLELSDLLNSFDLFDL